MKLSTILSPQLMLVVSCILNTVQGQGCNADNCLRALFPSTNLASGSAFCATFTATDYTATTGFPSSLTAGCGANPSRYSSACSCAPTVTTTTSSAATCTATNTATSTVISVATITVTSIATATVTSAATTTVITTSTSTSPYFPTDTSCIQEGQYINNGGFECALSPWAAGAFYGVTFGVAAPGHTGQYSYQVTQVMAPNNSDCCPELGTASLDQNIRLPPDAPGLTFALTFWTYFYTGSSGFVGVEIGAQPLYTVDAMDNPQDGWYMNTVTWVQPTDTFFTNIRFDYFMGQGTVVLIDDVAVAPDS